MAKAAMLLSSLAAAHAGSAEFSTTNMCKLVGIDNVKAHFDKTFAFSGRKATISCDYDLQEKQNFLSSVSVSGQESPSAAFGTLNMGYEYSHSFKTKLQALTLSLASRGARIKAAVDSNGRSPKLTEVGAVSKRKLMKGRNALPEGWGEYTDAGSGRKYYYNPTEQVSVWDRPGAQYLDVAIDTTYSPPSGVLQLKVGASGRKQLKLDMTQDKNRDGKLSTDEIESIGYSFGTTLSFTPKRKALTAAFQATQQMAEGRDLEAELDTDGVTISISDSNVDKGATWTAKLSTPLGRPSDSDLSFRRSVSF